MAITNSVSAYDRILANRARNRDFAELAEQRSAARQDAAQRTLSKNRTILNTLANTAADASAGNSQLMAMIIRSRMAAEAKEKAAPSKWYV